MNNFIKLFALFLLFATIVECAPTDISDDLDELIPNNDLDKTNPNNDSDETNPNNDLDEIDPDNNLKFPGFPHPNWPWDRKKKELKPNPNEFETPTTNTYEFEDAPDSTEPDKKPSKNKKSRLGTPQIILIVVIAIVLASALTYYIMYLRKKQLSSNFQQI